MTKNSNMFTIRMGSNISRYFDLIKVEFSSFIYLFIIIFKWVNGMNLNLFIHEIGLDCRRNMVYYSLPVEKPFSLSGEKEVEN